MHKLALISGLLLAWPAPGLAHPAHEAAAQEHAGDSVAGMHTPAPIAVTLPPLAGLVRMLKPDARVTCLLDAGGDPHHFRMRPHTVAQLKQARLLLRASSDDGSWPLPPRHANSVDLGGTASHFWLLPANVAAALKVLAARLKSLYPEDAGPIDSRLKQAKDTAAAMQQAWQQRLKGMPGVIMQHPSWLGLFRSMRIPVLAVLESGHHGDEVTPRELEASLNILKQHAGIWLIGDTAHSSRALQWLARHADAEDRLIVLDPLGYCGQDWVELMQDNLKRLPAAAERY